VPERTSKNALSKLALVQGMNAVRPLILACYERYGVPGREAKLAVTGRIEQGFSFGGRSFATILRETERRH